MEGRKLVKHRPKVTKASLPRTGTKLHSCLMVLKLYHPDSVTTGRISAHTGVGVSEAAAHLAKLSNRGLIDKVLEGQGKQGGSSWKLTLSAEHALGMRRR